MPPRKNLILSCLAAGSVALANPVDDAYRSMTMRTLYTLNDHTLHSGSYRFDGENGSEDADLRNITIPGTYFFGDYLSGFRPYVEGAVGYSHYEQGNARFGTLTSGDIDQKSFYLKGGGGVSYTFTNEITLAAGATFLYLNSDGDYDSHSTGNGDVRARELFNGTQNSRLYDLRTTLSYMPHYDGYRPYLVATAHYLSFDYDAPGIDNDYGWSGNLRAGFFTHDLARWWGMPLQAEVYVNGNFLDHGLAESIGFDSAFSGGTTFYWKIGSLIPFDWLKELDVTFTIQGTVSNTDINGYNIGFGLSLLKF